MMIFPAFGDNRSTQKINYFHKFKKPLVVDYTGTGTTNEGTNHVYLLVASNESANAPVFAWTGIAKYSEV